MNGTACPHCGARYITARSRSALGVSDSNHHSRVILLIIESGALISAAKLTEFVLFQLAPVDGLDGLNALYIVYEAMPQITVSSLHFQGDAAAVSDTC